MARIRLERVARQMKQVISRVVTQELNDPRCGFITIVGVTLSADLKNARVRFSVLGGDAQKRTVSRALENARGYIQTRVAQETALKYTPAITFQLDETAEREIALFQRIDQTVKADRRAHVARLIRAQVAGGSIPDPIVEEISRVAASEAFLESIATLLTDLMAVDTTPRPDLAALAADEHRCFEKIEAALKDTWADEIVTEFLPIRPEIEGHPAYTPPGYTDRPAAEAYEGRGNLLAVLRGAEPAAPQGAEGEEDADRLEPLRLAFNAHIDTIPPHIPPSREGETVWGRGACDAKGQVATVVAALRLLKHLRDHADVHVTQDLCAQFVIDEEIGGNGSLSLTLEDPFRFSGLVVCEATAFCTFTANRGALWYRAELTAPPDRAVDLAARMILALEDEGRALQSESDHPLFPQRPVQTNHGMIGPFGSAPSRVNDRVELEIDSSGVDGAAVAAAVSRAVGEYCAVYGDKTRERDPDTGRPKVARHVTLEEHGDGRFTLGVHGTAGHMGSLDQCDNAATKMAYVVRALGDLRGAGGDVRIALAGHEEDRLVVEGAQGFVPTHTIEQVASRLTAAAERAAADLPGGEIRITFDRLHNNAFAREADSALAVYAGESSQRAGLDVPPHPPGWETSCDARLFADAFLDRDVIVFGPGHLRHAHAPDERISLRDIAAGAKMLAFLVLESSGFVV